MNASSHAAAGAADPPERAGPTPAHGAEAASDGCDVPNSTAISVLQRHSGRVAECSQHPIPTELAEVIAQRLRVIGDPTRIRLLDALRDEERSVGELAELLGTSQQNASKHLGILLQAGILSRRKDGNDRPLRHRRRERVRALRADLRRAAEPAQELSALVGRNAMSTLDPALDRLRDGAPARPHGSARPLRPLHTPAASSGLGSSSPSPSARWRPGSSTRSPARAGRPRARSP